MTDLARQQRVDQERRSLAFLKWYETIGPSRRPDLTSGESFEAGWLAGAQHADGEAAPQCPQCSLPQSHNPHPEAGKPATLLEVNTEYVCIPCLTANRHKWATRAMGAEASAARLGALVERMRAYAAHKPDCETYHRKTTSETVWSGSGTNKRITSLPAGKPCTCGLAALLAAEAPKETPRG